jgi:acyl-CoA-binding protein
MTLDEQFDEAMKKVKQLPHPPSMQELLELYALYKQSTAGDVDGKRPGVLDVRGRAKYDAWEAKKGKAREAARQEYVMLVDRLATK